MISKISKIVCLFSGLFSGGKGKKVVDNSNNSDKRLTKCLQVYKKTCETETETEKNNEKDNEKDNERGDETNNEKDNEKDNKKEKVPKTRINFKKLTFRIICITLFLIYFYYIFLSNNNIIHKEQLKSIFNSYSIVKVIIDNHDTAYIYGNKDNVTEIFEMGINKYESFEDKLKTNFTEYIRNVPIIYNNKPGISFFSFINSIFAIILMYSFFNFKFSDGINNIVKNDAIQTSSEKTSLEEVVGMEDTKKEVLDIVDVILKPEPYTKMGAKIPAGILLEGPPGTGKTMLARAISNHYKCPFYYISGSDFIQIFVGFGSQKVKDLFKMARENRPCIIFIDEIDAIGKKRGGKRFGGHDERENILNALLVEMDGFQTNDGILILGATNRSDVLDSALLRPGRFDRLVKFNLPDMESRKIILKSYIGKTKLNENDDIDKISKEIAGLTYGFNNSQLANVCNEAIIYAVKNNTQNVSSADYEYACDYVLLGPIKKSENKKLHIIANHEIGHALTAYLLEYAENPRKVSIVPRAKGILGFSQNLHEDDISLYQKDELEHKLMVIMGGRVAEFIKFNKYSTGAHDDLQKINSIVRDMITKFGMDEYLGGMQIEHNKDEFYSCNSNNYLQIVDDKIQSYINNIEMNTKKLIKNNIKSFDKLVDLIIENETIYLEDIKCIIDGVESGKIQFI